MEKPVGAGVPVRRPPRPLELAADRDHESLESGGLAVVLRSASARTETSTRAGEQDPPRIRTRGTSEPRSRRNGSQNRPVARPWKGGRYWTPRENPRRSRHATTAEAEAVQAPEPGRARDRRQTAEGRKRVSRHSRFFSVLSRRPKISISRSRNPPYLALLRNARIAAIFPPYLPPHRLPPNPLELFAVARE
jgi:hypothetical protein